VYGCRTRESLKEVGHDLRLVEQLRMTETVEEVISGKCAVVGNRLKEVGQELEV
jgi:uncharacterized protein YlzI (FlbEa/FlbD family)